MRKKVFICSPFRGDMEGNARKAAAYSRMVNILTLRSHRFIA